MKKRKRSIQEVIGVALLLAAMIGLFQWYTTKNSVQIEERNKNYASDSARQTMTRINEKMNNALELINTYAHFASEGLKEPAISELTRCCSQMTQARTTPQTDGLRMPLTAIFIRTACAARAALP